MSGWDETTVQQLRERGSLKWTAFPDALGAFVAQMDFGLAPPVEAAIADAARHGRTGYLPDGWRAELAQTTAEYYRDRHGWTPAHVAVIADVLSGLDLMLRRFTEPGSPVVVPTPAYMPFFRVPGESDHPVVEVPSLRDADGRYRLDLDGLDAAFAAGARVLILCNPWNPVGRVLERDELVALSAVVERHGARVFSDEIHAPLVLPGHAHVPYASVSDAAARHTMTATSTSKAFDIPGLKCAQLLLSNQADVDRFAEVGVSAGHGASTPGVLANIAAYRDGGPWLGRVLDELEGNRALLEERIAALPGLSVSPVEGTYIAWIDARGLGLDEPPADFFRREAHVALTDGAACGAPGFVRLVFATPRPVLAQMLDAIGDAVSR